MNTARIHASLRGLALALLLGSLAARLPAQTQALSTAMPYVQGSRKIVLEALEECLNEPSMWDYEFVTQGSWVRDPAQQSARSRPYGDPLLGKTSDHDLRLAFNGSEEEATTRWLKARRAVAGRINQRFIGKSAKEIETMLTHAGFAQGEAEALAKQGGEAVAKRLLKTVSIYPPNQLMRTVVDDKSAAAVFKKLGAVPSLADDVVEGVWGEGGLANIQGFENAGGKVFYRSSKGTIYAGATDLVHAAEGYGRYTVGGAANQAAQWADKALEVMHTTRDPEQFGKYLKRLRDEMKMARARSHLPEGTLAPAFDRLEKLIQMSGSEGAAIFDNPLTQQALRSTQAEAVFLRRLAVTPPGPARDLMIATLLEAPGPWAKAGEQLRVLSEGAYEAVTLDRVMTGLMVYLGTKEVARKAGAEGLESALRQAGVEAVMIANFPAGLMLSMWNGVIDGAKATGYVLITQPQQWDDFLAGISEVKGFEGETALNRSIEDFATRYARTKEVEDFVYLQAFNISGLHDTGAAVESDATRDKRETTARVLRERMMPLVLKAWAGRRREILADALQLLLAFDEDLNNRLVTVELSPALPMLGAGSASAEARLVSNRPWATAEDLLEKYERTLVSLGGEDHIVAVSTHSTVAWEQDGRRWEKSSLTRLTDPFQPETITFTRKGPQLLKATWTLELRVYVGGGLESAQDVSRAQPLLERTIVREIPVEVTVGAELKATVPPAVRPKLDTPREVTLGERFNVNFPFLPEQRGKRYMLVLAPAGTKLKRPALYEIEAMQMVFNSSDSDVSSQQWENPLRLSDGTELLPLKVVSKSTGDGTEEVVAQVPMVEALSAAKPYELTVIWRDGTGSMMGDLNSAMEQANKAMEELDKKMAEMTPEQREELTKRMEAATAAAENGTLPPAGATAADMMQEELPETSVLHRPVLVRPPRIDFTPPEGWVAGDIKPTHVGFERKLDRPDPPLSLEGSIGLRLDSDVAWRNSVYQRDGQPMEVAIGDYKGSLLVRRDQHGLGEADQNPMNGGAGGAAEGLLRNGATVLHVEIGVNASGARLVRTNAKGEQELAYDTRAEAAELGNKMFDAALAALRAVKMASLKTPEDAQPPKDEVAGVTHLRLVPAKTDLEPGEFCEVKCMVDFPKPGEDPVRWEWSGNHAGDGDSVTFFASAPGTYGLSVMVYSSQGLIGSTSVDLTVH
jgi:hypothetical protein